MIEFIPINPSRINFGSIFLDGGLDLRNKDTTKKNGIPPAALNNNNTIGSM